jgi:hypothetical protein
MRSAFFRGETNPISTSSKLRESPMNHLIQMNEVGFSESTDFEIRRDL